VELGWKAERGLREMVADDWRWRTMNPKGFDQNGMAG
jgi:UDP-glucose 4-epimerase